MLRGAFSEDGTILMVKILKDSPYNDRGLALVLFEDRQSVETAIMRESVVFNQIGLTPLDVFRLKPSFFSLTTEAEVEFYIFDNTIEQVFT